MNHYLFDKKNMNAAIDASLKRLKTDYLDLYQLHWPERKVPKFGQLDFKYDPTDKIKANQNIQESQRDGKVLTGLLYADPEAMDLREILNVSDKPLNKMEQKELCPGSEKLQDINSGLK